MEPFVKPTLGKAFYTDIPRGEFDAVIEHNKKLGKYIDKFDSRLTYAKWKQDLVLMYNYEPLTSIVKKSEDLKKQYIKKIQEENESNERLYNTDKIMNELTSFKEFSEKLQVKLTEIQIKIDTWEMKKEILAA
jgi:hypothetical protein